MPADLQKMLEENPSHRPNKIEQFSGGKWTSQNELFFPLSYLRLSEALF
jgi:hypothetical protein